MRSRPTTPRSARRPLGLLGAVALIVLVVLGASPRAGAQEEAAEAAPTRLLRCV